MAAYEKRTLATADDVLRVAVLALRHRLRKDPLESSGDEVRIERAIADIRAKHKVG
jgi:magnesium chelatase subunit I